MLIIATSETIEGGTFATTAVEAKDYPAGFATLSSTVPEGQSIITVRVKHA